MLKKVAKMKITINDLIDKNIDLAFIKRYKNLGFENVDWGNVEKITINDLIMHGFLYDLIFKFKIPNIELLYDSDYDNELLHNKWDNNGNLVLHKETLKDKPDYLKIIEVGYNENNKKIFVKRNNDTSLYCIYNEKGKLIKHETKNDKAELISETNFIYDENDKLIDIEYEDTWCTPDIVNYDIEYKK